MFPLDEQDMEIVAPEGWARLDRVVLIAADLLGPVADAILPKGIAAKILAILKPAEALARRLLYLLAPTITLKPAPPAKAGASGHFVRSLPHKTPASAGETDISLPQAPPARPSAPQTAAKLRARLIALSMVLGDPDHHARRLARFLARRATKAVPRPIPLNFDNVPGLGRKRLDEDLRDALEFTNAAAHYKATAPPG